MEGKKRVLIAGVGQSNFLKQLCSSIHRVEPNSYEFDIYGLHELSGKDEYGINVFKNVFYTRNNLLIRDLKYLVNLKLFKLLINILRYNGTIRNVLGFARKFIITRSQYKEFQLFNYDIIHLHFPTYGTLHLLWHLPKDIQCVVSFWGSDLMRTSGFLNYFAQLNALNRANIITTHGNEMKQQILTKFGRNLEEKIVLTRFPPYEKLYNLIEKRVGKPKASFSIFLKKFGIPLDKKIIVIGHNGNSANNHIQIIQTLAELPANIKENLFVILPFTYIKSKNGIYEEKCQLKLREVGLAGILLKDFLTWDELADLKCITDIMIHMPVSDALSGAMTEAIFAGAKVITGDWLPYSPFYKEGLTFESTNFINLNHTFIKVVTSLPEENCIVIQNREIIKSKFLSDYCARTWLPVLK